MKKFIIISAMLLLFFTARTGIANAQINILEGLSREKTAEPGETYKDKIIITNKEEGIQEVKIYQTDYLFFCDGDNIYGEPGKISRSNAKWITFRPKRLKIGEGKVVDITPSPSHMRHLLQIVMKNSKRSW